MNSDSGVVRCLLCLLLFVACFLVSVTPTDKAPSWQPEFTKAPPEKVTAVEDDTVWIHCQLKPAPLNYTFYEAWQVDICDYRRNLISCHVDNASFDEASLKRFVLFTNGTLRIRNVSLIDMNNYQCRAKYAGVKPFFVHLKGSQLYVLARPLIVPSHLNCSRTPLRYGSRLRLRCNDELERLRAQRQMHMMQYQWFWRDLLANKSLQLVNSTFAGGVDLLDDVLNYSSISTSPSMYTVLTNGKSQDLVVAQLTSTQEFVCVLSRIDAPHLTSTASCVQHVLRQGETPVPEPLWTLPTSASDSQLHVGCQRLEKKLVIPRVASISSAGRGCLNLLGDLYMVSARRSSLQVQQAEKRALARISQLEAVLGAHLVENMQTAVQRLACVTALKAHICAIEHPPCSVGTQHSDMPVCSESCDITNNKLCSSEVRIFVESVSFNISSILQGLHCGGNLAQATCHPLKLDRAAGMPGMLANPTRFYCVESSEVANNVAAVSRHGSLQFAVLWAQRGGSYRGSKSVSHSGTQCVAWSRVVHAGLTWYSSAVLHDFVDVAAECRNPFALRRQPFCFVERPLAGAEGGGGLVEELCDVAVCSPLVKSTQTELMGTLLFSLSFLLLLMLIATIMWVCRRRKLGQQVNQYHHSVDGSHDVLDSTLCYRNGCFITCHADRAAQKRSTVTTAVRLIGRKELYFSSTSLTVEIDPSVAPLLQSNPLYQKSTLDTVNIKGYSILDPLQFDRNQMIQLEDIGVGCFGPVFLAETSQPLPGLIAWKAAMSDVSDDYLSIPSTPSTPAFFTQQGGTFGQICSSPASRFELPSVPGVFDMEDGAVCIGGGGHQRFRFAVRMLDSNKCADDREAFLKVAALMASLHHPCIVALLGVCGPQAPLCMLLEYCAGRDLTTFLRNANPLNPRCESLPHVNGHLVSMTAGSGAVENAQLQISRAQLLGMAEQVALGMVYLSNQGYVFRDLATRNCLITANQRVKISDFGLCRAIPRGQPYLDHGGLVPVRWTAPEALQAPRFYVASDVWSFGVLLWEIFSWGALPYSEFVKAEDMVPRMLYDETLILERPSGPLCTSALYDVMLRCWQRNMKLRPKFNELQMMLRALRKEEMNQESGISSDMLQHS